MIYVRVSGFDIGVREISHDDVLVIETTMHRLAVSLEDDLGEVNRSLGYKEWRILPSFVPEYWLTAANRYLGGCGSDTTREQFFRYYRFVLQGTQRAPRLDTVMNIVTLVNDQARHRSRTVAFRDSVRYQIVGIPECMSRAQAEQLAVLTPPGR